MNIKNERCSPLEMRKNLSTVYNFEKAGIDFVAMPVLNEEDKKVLTAELLARLDVIASAGEVGK